MVEATQIKEKLSLRRRPGIQFRQTSLLGIFFDVRLEIVIIRFHYVQTDHESRAATLAIGEGTGSKTLGPIFAAFDF